MSRFITPIVESIGPGPSVMAPGDGLEGIYHGFLNSVPANGQCLVVVPGLDPLHHLEAICPPNATGSVGDVVLVAVDDDKQLWVVESLAVPRKTVARAYRAAALTLTAAAWTLFPLDTEQYDPGNNFNPTTHLYVCPVAGFYQVNGAVFGLTSVSGDGVIAGISHQGGLPSVRGGVAASVVTAIGAESATVSDLVQCNVGDTLGLAYFAANADSVQTGAGGCYFSTFLAEQ